MKLKLSETLSSTLIMHCLKYFSEFFSLTSKVYNYCLGVRLRVD